MATIVGVLMIVFALLIYNKTSWLIKHDNYLELWGYFGKLLSSKNINLLKHFVVSLWLIFLTYVGTGLILTYTW